jgi:glutathione synthase
VINSVDALMHFKSKYFLASHSSTFRYPKTFASNDPEELFKVISEYGVERWIAKPPAGSLGRDIFLLTARDPNTHVILESMTGPEADEYCLLQPYVEEIKKGEKRVLIAGGEPVGQYLRHARKDHRTNVMHNAEIEPCDLDKNEYKYCQTIGSFLVAHGADFVGVDLAYPYVIEFNVINPGGLLTIESLTGKDLTADIIDRVFPKTPNDSSQST